MQNGPRQNSSGTRELSSFFALLSHSIPCQTLSLFAYIKEHEPGMCHQLPLTLDLCQSAASTYPHLIVCPLSVMATWAEASCLPFVFVTLAYCLFTGSCPVVTNLQSRKVSRSWGPQGVEKGSRSRFVRHHGHDVRGCVPTLSKYGEPTQASSQASPRITHGSSRASGSVYMIFGSPWRKLTTTPSSMLGHDVF